MPSYRVGPNKWMSGPNFGAAMQAANMALKSRKTYKKVAGPIKRMALRRQTKKYGTKPKTGGLFQKAKLKVQGCAAAGTYSTYTHKSPLNKWNKGLSKSGTQSAYTDTTSGRFISTIGQQNPGLAMIYAQATDLRNFIQSVQPALAINTNTRKILMQDFQGIIYMTNQSKAPLALDIYDLVPRRDIPTSGNDPIQTWEQGLVDAGAIPTSGYSFNYNLPGSTPFISPAFCQKWLIKKVTKVEMPQGSTHEHRVHHEINRMINQEMLNDLVYVKGLTGVTLFVQRGFPADDGGTVSLASTALDLVNTFKYNFTSISDSVSTVNQLSHIVTSLREQDIINVGSGQVEPNQFA